MKASLSVNQKSEALSVDHISRVTHPQVHSETKYQNFANRWQGKAEYLNHQTLNNLFTFVTKYLWPLLFNANFKFHVLYTCNFYK